MGRSKSSNQWLQEHFNDEFVKQAQIQGFRSRAVFKLQEIQQKDNVIRPGMNVVDLGAAPGAWLQYVKRLLKGQGRIVGLDILPIEAIDGVHCVQGDFREESVMAELSRVLENIPVHVVLSDMAPNLTGNKAIDQPASIYLAELALEMAEAVLSPEGCFVVKVFQGEGFDDYKREVGQLFSKVLIRKPKASRPRSNEVYILGKGFKKHN
ncbi:MAG: 23S rRNA (uridine(2552)-2'-O)-methyltransferase RlmE [Methylococcales bacterium]|jgi:23S rRNA (uridine2552-2'-O)-methyltransferase|nr:23S rRNA (uridine(2552)-2'-O)-methyltransferase RlmE [Methylococcales bacterium]MBT4600299.1 23S rRNA (uridine(2552)-2'-O)-methyltransferase RlmE [Methylococcales bacterium]MDP7562787.1 23S rRNA (uridine(2552)-2'-O)-methyltransferase RlmE [Methylococcales bacterium]